MIKIFNEPELYPIYKIIFQTLTDEEKADVKTEVKVSIFEDCFVKLEDIFSYEF